MLYLYAYNYLPAAVSTFDSSAWDDDLTWCLEDDYGGVSRFSIVS